MSVLIVRMLYIHKILGSKARTGVIVGNFKAFFLESTWMICWTLLLVL